MRATLVHRAQHARTPLIKFLGQRSTPKNVDHAPQPHPASPTHSLPDSFASYRARAQQHGPMNKNVEGSGPSAPIAINISAMTPYGAVGGTPASKLGSIKPKQGEYFDRSDLPQRFGRLQWSDAEMDAVTSGGASMW